MRKRVKRVKNWTPAGADLQAGCLEMSENGTSGKLTPRQRRAIRALLSGTGTKQDAAEAAGVSVRTLYRWEQLDVFRQALLDAEADALSELSRTLVRLAGIATDVLEDAMRHAETDGQRIRAAIAVLDKLLAIRELTTIEQRLAALEQANR